MKEIIRNCLICQKEFQIQDPRGKYCSPSCGWVAIGLSKRKPLEERFWSKVKRAGPDDCWEWQAGKTYDGYGSFGGVKGATTAHRMSYILRFGPIPEGMCICHRCDNRICVNPDHFFLGTPVENTADMDRKGRRKSPGNQQGSHNSASKLTEDLVKEIRASYAAGGVTTLALAEKYHVTRPLISKVINNHIWNYL